MPAGEHKSLGAVLNLKRHNLWVHQPKIRNRAMSQTSQPFVSKLNSFSGIDLTLVGYM
jgi:hypothetical protein